MDLVMLLSINLLTSIVTSAEEVNKKCLRLVPPVILGCCKSGFMAGSRSSDMEEECMQVPDNSCARDVCIGKQFGYIKEDGDIDSQAFEKLLLQIIKKAPPLITALKKNCIDELGRFGPPGVCQALKLKKCVQRQALIDCKEWRDKGPCAGIKELARQCV